MASVTQRFVKRIFAKQENKKGDENTSKLEQEKKNGEKTAGAKQAVLKGRSEQGRQERKLILQKEPEQMSVLANKPEVKNSFLETDRPAAKKSVAAGKESRRAKTTEAEVQKEKPEKSEREKIEPQASVSPEELSKPYPNMSEREQIDSIQKKMLVILAGAGIFLTGLFFSYLFILWLVKSIKDVWLKRLVGAKPALFVIFIYRNLCEIFERLGVKLNKWMDPLEVCERMSKDYSWAKKDLEKLTDIFLKARYSNHCLERTETRCGIAAYNKLKENILRSLKLNNRLWLNFKMFTLK